MGLSNVLEELPRNVVQCADWWEESGAFAVGYYCSPVKRQDPLIEERASLHAQRATVVGSVPTKVTQCLPATEAVGAFAVGTYRFPGARTDAACDERGRLDELKRKVDLPRNLTQCAVGDDGVGAFAVGIYRAPNKKTDPACDERGRLDAKRRRVDLPKNLTQCSSSKKLIAPCGAFAVGSYEAPGPRLNPLTEERALLAELRALVDIPRNLVQCGDGDDVGAFAVGYYCSLVVRDDPAAVERAGLARQRALVVAAIPKNLCNSAGDYACDSVYACNSGAFAVGAYPLPYKSAKNSGLAFLLDHHATTATEKPATEDATLNAKRKIASCFDLSMLDHHDAKADDHLLSQSPTSITATHSVSCHNLLALAL